MCTRSLLGQGLLCAVAVPELHLKGRGLPAVPWRGPGVSLGGEDVARLLLRAAAAAAGSGDQHAAPAAPPAPSAVPAPGSGTARSVRRVRTARRRQQGECSKSGAVGGTGPQGPSGEAGAQRDAAPEAPQKRREPRGTGMPKPPGGRKRWPPSGLVAGLRVRARGAEQSPA